MTGPRVALVLVSHSARLAAGVAEVAAQMAPDTTVIAVGGTGDGGLGTSFEAISDALARADSAAGVIVLYDLGSARLTAETALEFAGPDAASRAEIVDAPLVEGALAAAARAQVGGTRAEVAAAARSAGGPAAGTEETGSREPDGHTGPAGPEGPAGTAGPAGTTALHRSVLVRNPLGLHARPAAELSRRASELDARVLVGRPGGPRADLRSLLAVVGLAIRGGDTVDVLASGPDAAAALDLVTGLIGAGFGELATDAPRPGAPGPGGTAPSAPGPGEPGGTGPDGTGPGAAEPGTGRPGGTGASPGRAIGPAVRLAALDVPARPGAGQAVEQRRLAAAVAAAATELERGGPLARAHAVLLRDPQLQDAAAAGLAAGLAAESAWWRATTELAAGLAGSADELVAARAVDVREAGAAVLTRLGTASDRIPPAGELRGAVLVADELGPGEVAAVAERGGVAVVLSGGSPAAHAVLVARNLGLPMVLGTGRLLAGVRAGAILDVDGTSGRVLADPPGLDRRRAEVAAQARRQARLRELAAGPVTVGGTLIRVEANIGSLAEARAAVAAGADGVGLLRTELLLLDSAELPGEDAQAAQLSEIFAVLGGRPVVVRVLDAGGDKPVRALRLDPIHNGFLGVRGWRWLQQHPGVLHTQLRAVCRAAPGHHVEIMAPMITLASEAAAFAAAVGRAAASLAADGIVHARPARVGVMIEVPAAALAADEIAAEVDFLSVGTNDLVAYTMAADRTQPSVAALADPSATAVWRLLEQVCAGAARGGADVSVCGEMAADERFAARLVGLGVTGLSMAAGRIPAVKAQLRAG